MISSLRGLVQATEANRIVLEVGGVGYSIAVTAHHSAELKAGESAFVYTALIVREDELSLYGFADANQLSVFELLRSVTGVGPKSALGVLAAMTVEQISTAINDEDDAAFRRVSGIGPKTAKLIIVSLAGKLPAGTPTSVSDRSIPSDGALPASVRADVVLALVGLGWNERTAATATDQVIYENPGVTQVASLLRLTLTHLGPPMLERAGDNA